METRTFGISGFAASTIGLGTWQLGADWGDVTNETATQILHAALNAGTTFIDTADVYGDGRSESTIGRFLANTPDHSLFVATKMGRRVEQKAHNYTPEAFAQWNARSRANLGVESLDLVQLHCPPTEVLRSTQTWDELRRMVDRGHIRHYGASVETCEQAHIAMDNGAQSLQIIVNVFRRKPLESVIPEALERGVAVIARVPLASGLLSGKYTEETRFPDNDHRTYNRHGEAFDVGETFSGVPFDIGIQAARKFSALCERHAPAGATPTQVALKWVIDQGVTTVIPGARNVEQVQSNTAAADLPPLGNELLEALEELYDRSIRPHVHERW